MKRRLNRKIIIIMELSPLLHSKPPSISIRSLVATKKMDLINTCILCWTHEILISWFRFWCGVLKNCVCYSSGTFSSFFSCSLSSCIHFQCQNHARPIILCGTNTESSVRKYNWHSTLRSAFFFVQKAIQLNKIPDRQGMAKGQSDRDAKRQCMIQMINRQTHKNTTIFHEICMSV